MRDELEIWLQLLASHEECFNCRFNWAIEDAQFNDIVIQTQLRYPNHEEAEWIVLAVSQFNEHAIKWGIKEENKEEFRNWLTAIHMRAKEK